ncbi:polyprenol reductase-like isoform X3 [Contarinia nasturtii]|uniref:polyprenol reductase-like isoform X3 n=1 Tax=Contarinia nasturtii TaxID=265458 RepID=UPI0012D379F4|nr:polyprenol reductase-like isoform X3 [Contarinia nasturtii]
MNTKDRLWPLQPVLFHCAHINVIFFSFHGKPTRVVQASEVPKSYFKHFYVFAIVWAILIFSLTFNLYVLGTTVPGFVIDALDFLYGKDRVANISAFTALQTTFLLTLQCARRFYETQYIQVFSKQAKINFVHYLVGYLHYFGAFLAIISQAPGFVRSPQAEDLTYIHIDMVYQEKFL